jgi:CRISPR-associated endonuclease Csn1
MQYILGLDIGITSVGWCVLESNENLEPKRIEDLGVRLFNRAENPKTGASLALPRRMARGSRRLLKRKRTRMKQIKNLLINMGLISLEKLHSCFSNYHEPFDSPWLLRAKALDEIVSEQDFARILIHIAKRRGFKSPRKTMREDEESGKVKSAIQENRKLLEAGSYRTVGEMFYKDPKFENHKRNKGSYEFCVARSMLVEEVKEIFKHQASFGNKFASQSLLDQYLGIFTRVCEPQDEYDAVGNCTFEKNEKRAPMMCYSTELFMLYQKINNLTLLENYKPLKLNNEQRAAIIDMAFHQKDIKFSQIRKKLGLDETIIFKGLSGSKKDVQTAEKKKFVELKFWHMMKKHFENNHPELWLELCNDIDKLDVIGQGLTYFKKKESIRNFFKKNEFTDSMIEACMELDFNGVASLSLKAIKRLLPFLSHGMVYSEACAAAGYNHSIPLDGQNFRKYLPQIADDITNPVVKRALIQSRKVVNAIVKKYGSPLRINIELARELGKNFSDRKEIQKKQEESQKTKEKTVESLKENFGIIARGSDVLKQRLYEEQNSKCVYCRTPFDLHRVITEPGYVEIDHAIPFSRSFDNSYNNKVLACQKCNQEKKDRTPFEFLGHNQLIWEEFEAWVKAIYFGKLYRKGVRLLTEEFGPDQESEFKERNLVDTRYITSYFASFLRNNLTFKESSKKKKVLSVNGAITAMLRGCWGLAKSRDNHLHHALDAAVVSTTTDSLIKRITDHFKRKETWSFNNHEAIKERLPIPYECFRDELLARLSDDPVNTLKSLDLYNYEGLNLESIKPVFISRKPEKKETGAAHQETIRSKKKVATKGVSTIRKPVDENLTADMIERIVDKEGGSKWIYEQLKAKLAAAEGKSKVAFKPPVIIKKAGEDHLIRRIKIEETCKSGIEVNNGIANNGDIIRIDVFTERKPKKKGKYYVIPIYASDAIKDQLPNRAIVANKEEADWTLMDENFLFKFSLYPNELFYLKSKNYDGFGYYTGVDRATSAISFSEATPEGKTLRVSPKSADVFEKWSVDVLGNYCKAINQKRKKTERNTK